MNRGASLTNLAANVKRLSVSRALAVQVENQFDRAAAHGAEGRPAAAEHDAILLGTIAPVRLVVGPFEGADPSRVRATRQQLQNLRVVFARDGVDLGVGPSGTTKRDTALLAFLTEALEFLLRPRCRPP